VSKLPQGGRLCPQRQDDTNQERQSEKSTEVFLFFFFFLPEGSASSWAPDKHQPAVGKREAQLPRRSGQGKVLTAIIAGSGFPIWGQAKASRPSQTWDKEANCVPQESMGSWAKESYIQPGLPPLLQCILK
jgi:hypothetical protein